MVGSRPDSKHDDGRWKRDLQLSRYQRKRASILHRFGRTARPYVVIQQRNMDGEDLTKLAMETQDPARSPLVSFQDGSGYHCKVFYVGGLDDYVNQLQFELSIPRRWHRGLGRP